MVLVLILDLGAAHIHDVASCTAATHHGEQQKSGAAQHSQVEQDLHPGDVLLQGNVVVLHRGVGVGLVISRDVVIHIVDKACRIRQLIAHSHRAVLIGHRSRCAGGGRQQTGQHPARGLSDAFRRGLRQGQLAFLQLQGDHAGIQVQLKGRDLQFFKIVHHGRITYQGAAGGIRAAQHRPDHQHRCQGQSQDQRVKTGSFGLQSDQLQFIKDSCLTFRIRWASALPHRAGCGIFRRSPGHNPPQTHPAPGSRCSLPGCLPGGGWAYPGSRRSAPS